MTNNIKPILHMKTVMCTRKTVLYETDTSRSSRYNISAKIYTLPALDDDIRAYSTVFRTFKVIPVHKEKGTMARGDRFITLQQSKSNILEELTQAIITECVKNTNGPDRRNSDFQKFRYPCRDDDCIKLGSFRSG